MLNYLVFSQDSVTVKSVMLRLFFIERVLNLMPILIANWFDWAAIASDWQTAVALGIVFLAAVATVPRIWKLFSSQHNNAGCGNCSGCKNGSGATSPMVNIQLKQK